MKKFHLIFLVSALIIFVACGSDKKTGERLPQSEITDEDIDDTESGDDTSDSSSNHSFIPTGNICTGQDACYSNFGGEIDCPAAGEEFYGQDAQYAEQGICVPLNFTVQTVSGDDIVIDNNTGLVWKQAKREIDNKYIWEEAESVCLDLNNSNYAGYSDWRLPLPEELLTTINNDRIDLAFHLIKVVYSDPSLNREIDCLWTSKESDADSASALDPFTGRLMGSWFKNIVCDVLCVRGEELARGSFKEMMENDKRVVVDSTTGLMWQKEYSYGKNWAQALSYCQDLNDKNYANHNDWRLPNKNELASLLNHDKPAGFYLAFFPEKKLFWSSSTGVFTTYNDHAWYVDFEYGSVGVCGKHDDAVYVRCVR